MPAKVLNSIKKHETVSGSAAREVKSITRRKTREKNCMQGREAHEGTRKTVRGKA